MLVVYVFSLMLLLSGCLVIGEHNAVQTAWNYYISKIVARQNFVHTKNRNGNLACKHVFLFSGSLRKALLPDGVYHIITDGAKNRN